MCIKTKRSGIFAALTAVLFAATILMTSCLEPIGFDGLEKDKINYQITPGKGLVLFSIADIKGRAILEDVMTASDFSAYDLFIYNDDGAVPGTWDSTCTPAGTSEGYTGTNPVRITSLTTGIEIDEASYFFRLNAFQYDQGLGVGLGTMAATGMSGLILVEANEANNVPVTLTAVGVAGTGVGQFKYTFVFPPHANTIVLPATTGLEATIEIVPLSSGGTAVAEKQLLSGVPGAGSEDLKPGYYSVIVKMEQEDYQNYTYIDTLRIYEGMTSTAANIALPSMKYIRYGLTFHFNDGGNPANQTATTTHGTELNIFMGIAANSALVNPPHRVDPTYLFDGWYPSTTDATNRNNKFGTSYMFIKNGLSLYAGWVAGTSLAIIPTYTPGPGMNSPVLVGDYTNYNHSNGDFDITLSITNDTDYTLYRWYNSADAGYIETTDSTYVLEFNDANVHYKAAGEIIITVHALLDKALPTDEDEWGVSTIEIDVVD